MLSMPNPTAAPTDPHDADAARLFDAAAGDGFGDGLDDVLAEEAQAAFEAAAHGLRALPAGDLDEAQLAQWIGSVVDRDERALTALYDATVSRVHGIVLRIVRRPALAEEVVEDTFFQVWRQAPRFDPVRGGPLTWLLGMARSRAIDAVRREARFQHDGLDDESAEVLAAEAAAHDELLDAARGHAELHRALLLLQAQPRQLVALAFFRGLSHEEIALQTALPLGTVKSQIRRAMLTLRQLLGETGGPALAA